MGPKDTHKRISLYLENAMDKKRLEVLARARGVSVNELVTNLIALYLSNPDVLQEITNQIEQEYRLIKGEEAED